MSDYAGVGHLIDGICEDVETAMQRNRIAPSNIVPFPVAKVEEQSAAKWLDAQEEAVRCLADLIRSCELARLMNNVALLDGELLRKAKKAVIECGGSL